MAKNRNMPGKKGKKAGKKPAGKNEGSNALVRLLRDPCGADVNTATAYLGSTGYVSRFTKDVTIGTGAGETAGMVAFTPSVLNYTSAVTTAPHGLNLVATTGAGISGTLLPSDNMPGSTFLKANASNYKVLAACVQVMYTGAESTRAGWISIGNCPATALINASGSTQDGYAPDGVAGGLPIIRPIDAQVVECVWKPDVGDHEAQTTTAVTGASCFELFTGKGSIVIAFGGLPATAGLRIRLTTVVEWAPEITFGAVANTTLKNHSNAFERAVAWLEKTSSKWWFRLGHAMLLSN